MGCGSSMALAVCTDELLGAATCLALCGGVADSSGPVHGEKTDDGLRAAGCECRADNTLLVVSLTPGRRRGGLHCLHTRLEKKNTRLGREHKLYFGKVSLSRSLTSASENMFFFYLLKQIFKWFHVRFRWIMVLCPLLYVY